MKQRFGSLKKLKGLMSPYPQLLKGRESIYKLTKLEMKLRTLLGVSSLGLIPNPTQMFS